MKRLILNIVSALTSPKAVEAFSNAGLVAPATTDIYLGQPAEPDFEFALPAIFVDYNADYNNELAYIYVHVLQEYAEDTEGFCPVQQEGLLHLDYLTIVKRLLKGLKTRPVFGALKVHTEVPTVSDAYYWHTLTFSCTIESDLDVDDKYINAEKYVYTLEKGKLQLPQR